MLPLTLLAPNKVLNLLTANGALSQAIASNAAASGFDVPLLHTQQIMNSYVSPDMGDLNLQLTYPRVCIYTSQVANTQREKFKAFSGTVTVVLDVWSSASLEPPSETALHFYLEGIADILHANLGDWGDGFRYSGVYGVQLHTPQIGGFGFVQLARITCNLQVTY